ncbi:hypothetical protein JQX13_44450 [Archangium violaceum]|uniref:hypothetical protein n=1 Tax=Archangium violaceum TaxID=83451 RepID=UPI00193C39BB|nr:hypothetical protein [Archangium violaceum]QRK07037.1 hypothetical protein JQX13_44450 [Archangium violaceum]
MKNVFSGVLVAALALVGLTGCSSDCNSYCNRYQECLASDLNVDRCVDRCEEASEEDDDHEERVAECSECVNSRTCAEANEDCIDDCFFVVGP